MPRFMRRLASFVTGRRSKWAVLGIWLLLVVAIAPLGSKLADETNDRTESFLPKSAESTKVVKALNNRFAGGQYIDGLIVYRRKGGLNQADRQKIASDAAATQRVLPVLAKPRVPFGTGATPGLVSPDRSTAYTAFTVPDNYDKVGDWGKDLRDEIGDGSGGLDVFLTGDVGFNTDAKEVFGSLDTKLLLATVLLVLVLLGAIYRSPLMAITPLVVVGVSYSIAQGLIYLYAKSGATVSTNSTSILVVLMFGVGTDYCLLLMSRYREELRRWQDKHEAMRHALQRVGPAILASGLTVALTMLVLLLAEVGSIRSLGPVAAIGVTSTLIAGLTLLPAMLSIFGRRGFWPRGHVVAYRPDEAVRTEHPGMWRRFGTRVLRRPGLALGVTGLIFGAGALGLLAYKENYSTTNFFKKPTESVDGFKALENAFPSGTLSPTIVLVERQDGPVRPADVAAVQDRIRGVRGVASISDVQQESKDGHVARLALIFRNDPYTSGALDLVPKLRDRVDGAAPGATVLVGGGSPVQYDFGHATSRDERVIVPLALLVIAVILAVLLEALVAPLVLIASVIASFFGTLGISILFFRYVVGDPGIDSSLPIFAFIFLVSLGVDYTIFLMSRVREEARRYGTREGVLRALSATGPVITSAGIILAGTFSVLMTLPVTFAFNIGFMVAVGILLDTFVVRTIMVPAAIELLGDRVWWPSTASGGSRILRETDDPQAAAEPAV
jgi:RND superfamily putative drug exporter